MSRVGVMAKVSELVRERAVARELGENYKLFLKAARDGAIGIVFMFAILQISRDMGVLNLFLVAILAGAYVKQHDAVRFWTVVGLVTGSFVAMVAVLPAIITVEKVWVFVANIMRWHSADGPIFFGFINAGMIATTVAVVAFCPLAVRMTKANWSLYQRKCGIKKEILPWYFLGRRFAEKDPSLTRQ